MVPDGGKMSVQILYWKWKDEQTNKNLLTGVNMLISIVNNVHVSLFSRCWERGSFYDQYLIPYSFLYTVTRLKTDVWCYCPTLTVNALSRSH